MPTDSAPTAPTPSSRAPLARRPGPVVRTRVSEHRGEATRRHDDRVATEEPLEIRVAWPGAAARRVWTTMRTPGHDFELAAGFLRHEGITGVNRVAYCTDETLTAAQEFNVVTVTLEKEPEALPGQLPAASAGSAACGVCGTDSIDAVLALACRSEQNELPEPDLDLVRSLPGRLRSHQPIFDKTGGVHAAGAFDATGRMLVAREDIGRHNAVDKVTGSRVLAGQDPAATYLVVSGRAGFELVQKAVAAGFGTLVAVGAPSSLAVDLARAGGLGLIGFTRDDRCVVYH